AFLSFLRTHAITLTAAGAAGISFCFSPATAWYQAIDWRTLNLLFCLMFVVAGMRSCALFRTLAATLLKGQQRYRPLAHILVQLTFFLSMLITNDVALLALTPFAIYLLDSLNLRDRIPGLIVLQTVAANLGSMATPVGNPQNLFLYTAFEIAPLDFFWAMVPITLIGALLLLLLTHLLKDAPLNTFETPALPQMPRQISHYLILFVICLCAVFRVLSDWVPFGIIIIYALLFARPILRKVGYGLLLTFICFFVFSGNLAQITAIRELLTGFLEHHTQATAAITSQLLSNVPAAILLEPFTTDWKGLLFGTDIGGFGTPIASLASLISLGIYLKEPDAKIGHYLILFTLINLLFLLVLSIGSCFL
ncbi:MAG: citrate transporter, partial [Kiritimatiellae bacterium]|nr:citrate transporter [Kiritimatiellia bacterium]